MNGDEKNSLYLERMYIRAESDIANLKEKVENLIENSKNGSNNVFSLRESIQNINFRITALEKLTEKNGKEIEKLSNNGFFEFTNNLDIKKIIALTLLASSLISSPTLISNLVNQEKTVSSERIDTLIKILEEKK